MFKNKTSRHRIAPGKDPLTLLDEIAHNVWWSWNPDAMGLFEYANPGGLKKHGNNPLLALRKMTAAHRRRLQADSDFAVEVTRVHQQLSEYLRADTWYSRKYGRKAIAGKLAYFCMEYALHESLPLYAGGLGVLAGDHLKSASDLGLPFVAVGVYWRRGYTRQSLDRKGCQQDRFPLLPVKDTPAREVLDRKGRPVRVRLSMGERTVVAGAYRIDVGRVPLYLLNTDLPENARADRKLVDVLYSGDRDMRIRQEILLGIGGLRLLETIGVPVTAYHLNEGHAAFLSLERIAQKIRTGSSFPRAVRDVANTNVFTTHTPVPAGNEEFDPGLVDRYLGHYAKLMGVDAKTFHDLARVKPGNTRESFGMTPLALHTSRYCNGVAALHGAIARKMWKGLYPKQPVRRVPIGHVTNGIHLRTWLHPEMAALFDEFLGADWEDRQDAPAVWKKAARIPDEILWDVHLSFKYDLADFCNGLKGQSRLSKGHMFDPEALTIGFARRFASYKRATLAFSNLARLARLVNKSSRPVQIVFAGKAHPADADGKNLIQQVVAFAKDARFKGHIWFLEDYEMGIARRLTAGVDVWLNNPQRPREASGTSGMKPALHGGLNLSILDGWWPEAYNGKNGWAIGRGENHDGTPAADKRDANQLYDLLERKVVPMYYDRDADGLPRRWVACMKNAITTIPVYFNTHRQVKEYWTKYYLPAMT